MLMLRKYEPDPLLLWITSQSSRRRFDLRWMTDSDIGIAWKKEQVLGTIPLVKVLQQYHSMEEAMCERVQEIQIITRIFFMNEVRF